MTESKKEKKLRFLQNKDQLDIENIQMTEEYLEKNLEISKYSIDEIKRALEQIKEETARKIFLDIQEKTRIEA